MVEGRPGDAGLTKGATVTGAFVCVKCGCSPEGHYKRGNHLRCDDTTDPRSVADFGGEMETAKAHIDLAGRLGKRTPTLWRERLAALKAKEGS